MSVYIYTEVDENDGDMVGKLTKTTPEKVVKLKTILAKLKDAGGDLRNWTSGNFKDGACPSEYLTDEEIEFVESFTAYVEWGWHGIEEFKIMEISSEEGLV